MAFSLKRTISQLRYDYTDINDKANGEVIPSLISDYPKELQEYWYGIKPFDPKEEKRITDSTYTTGKQRSIKGTERKLRGDW